MAFGLNLYPITYIARYNPDTKAWDEEWLEADHVTFDELMAMNEDKSIKLYRDCPKTEI